MPNFQYLGQRAYDFTGGVPISKETIEHWVKEILQKLSDEPDLDSSYIASGNTIVIGIRFANSVKIVVTNNYTTFDVKKRTDTEVLGYTTFQL
jgi:hypothetical protein|tara:strand:+ start:155 stop:433 length:279 start_codon:yes stop_codon:yes gene_type:complete